MNTQKKFTRAEIDARRGKGKYRIITIFPFMNYG